MNDNTLKTICKVIGGIFIFFGLITLCSGVTLLVGIGSVQYAEALAQKVGESVIGDFPTAYGLLGALFAFALSVIYFGAGYGLITLKRWTYKAIFFLGGLGLVSGIYHLIGKNYMGIAEVFWGFVYLGFGYLLSKKRELFNN